MFGEINGSHAAFADLFAQLVLAEAFCLMEILAKSIHHVGGGDSDTSPQHAEQAVGNRDLADLLMVGEERRRTGIGDPQAGEHEYGTECHAENHPRGSLCVIRDHRPVEQHQDENADDAVLVERDQ